MKKTDSIGPGDLVLDKSFQEFVEGTNPDSVEKWKEWINSNPDKKETVEDAILLVKTLAHARKAVVTVDKNESLNEVLEQIERQEKKGNFLNFNSVWFKIAAISLLVIGLSSLWNLFHTRHESDTDLAFNEIIVPLGEKAQIVLSDGTHVWINSASKLRYPVKFGESSRDVSLEGEAYFDVTKKQGKTFVVNTRDVKVNVLGTAFNVKCYPGDEKTQTIVVRGLVKVEDVRGKHKALFIKPNEMATLREKTEPGNSSAGISSMTIDKVNPESLVSWKDQMLVFAGESFEDLAIKMERWFNVRIKIDNEDLKAQRYNGKFVHNETVYQVLEAIKVTTPITYEVYKDTIIISRKP